MGFSIPVITDGDSDLARSVAREMAKSIWQRRKDFVGSYPKPEEGITRAKELASGSKSMDGPVVAADLGPNSAAGGTADGTVVLREMLEQDIQNAGYAIVRDPESVEACVATGVGNRVRLTLGAKTDDQHGEPIEDLKGYVKCITDGHFVNTGPMGTGTTNHLGRTVLLQCNDAKLSIIITENLHSPRDAEIWRHVGLPPERFDVLVVQGTNHFRASYESIATEVFVIDSPGVGSPIPSRYEYTNIRRPQFPIDEMAVPTIQTGERHSRTYGFLTAIGDLKRLSRLSGSSH